MIIYLLIGVVVQIANRMNFKHNHPALHSKMMSQIGPGLKVFWFVFGTLIWPLDLVVLIALNDFSKKAQVKAQNACRAKYNAQDLVVYSANSKV